MSSTAASIPSPTELERSNDAPQTEARTPMRVDKRFVVGAVFALVASAFGVHAFLTRGHESTDDAMIDADIVAVQTQIGGTVREVLFDENRPVRAGQVLVILDQTEARARVAEANANVEAAEAAANAADADVDVVATRAHGDASLASANLRAAAAEAASMREDTSGASAALQHAEAARELAESDLRRANILRSQGSIADSVYEQTQTAARLAASNVEAARARVGSARSSIAEARGHIAEASARVTQASNVDVLVAQARARAAEAHARVEVARATLVLARIALANTEVMAPGDGYVSHRNVQVGQLVEAGHGVAQLVKPRRWITANFKETQIEGMHPGQPVQVHVDAYPDAEIWATVESIGGATGSRFTLLPPDNASGNFTKVVQRVPVRMRLGRTPRDVVLLPGMNVDATVHTRAGGS